MRLHICKVDVRRSDQVEHALETVAGAAEKWEYNADATEVTFTLRKNLKYSDGSLLNAEAL